MKSHCVRTSLLACMALALALGSSPTRAKRIDAAPEARSLGGCSRIESDAERLACYDGLAARQTRQKSTPDSNVYRSEPAPDPQATSMLDGRWELDADSKLGLFNLRAHKPIYLLPFFFSSAPNQQPDSPNPLNRVESAQGLKKVENKFQISFKTKVLEDLFSGRADLWFGYTQSSRWQLYNEDLSRPFRETNYEPEAMLVFGLDQPIGNWRSRMFTLSAVHQSNGRSLPLSRSWDRLAASFAIEREDWVAILRPWWRRPESAATDDNPDIADYLGRADLQIVHHRGGQEFAWMLRHSLRGGDRSHGAVQFDWSFPLHRYLRGHVQVFDGYGESLIDYNHRATYLGLGISLLPSY